MAVKRFGLLHFILICCLGPPMGRPGPPMHGPGPGPRMMQPHPNHGPEPLSAGPSMRGPHNNDMGPRGMSPRMEPPRGMEPDQRPMHDINNRPRELHGGFQNGPLPRVSWICCTNQNNKDSKMTTVARQ